MKVAQSIADKYGVSDTAVMIAWLVKIPHSIMPILGTSQLKRIDQAIEGLQLNLDDRRGLTFTLSDKIFRKLIYF